MESDLISKGGQEHALEQLSDEAGSELRQGTAIRIKSVAQAFFQDPSGACLNVFT